MKTHELFLEDLTAKDNHLAIYFKIPSDVIEAARIASKIVWLGYNESDCNGSEKLFCDCCNKVSAWCDESLHEIWIDKNCLDIEGDEVYGIYDSEPEPDYEYLQKRAREELDFNEGLDEQELYDNFLHDELGYIAYSYKHLSIKEIKGDLFGEIGKYV